MSSSPSASPRPETAPLAAPGEWEYDTGENAADPGVIERTLSQFAAVLDALQESGDALRAARQRSREFHERMDGMEMEAALQAVDGDVIHEIGKRRTFLSSLLVLLDTLRESGVTAIRRSLPAGELLPVAGIREWVDHILSVDLQSAAA